ncbi:MAG: TIGR03067 domain-containing protein [Acidobacteriia bacterium]|nr:TIGR03067 domain-containing protein [Terriglobia bacterium]
MKPRTRKTEPGPLEGRWSVVALEVEGQPMPAAMLGAARIVVEGDRFQSLGMGTVYEGTVKLDASASPKTFDLTFTAGPEKGNTALGIYELNDDEWKLCLTTRGGDRPKEFSTAPGTGHALETLKRGEVKPAPDALTVEAEAPAGAGPATELEGEWSMVSGFMDGHPIESSMVKYGRRVTRGNQTTVQFGPQVFMKATFTLDPSKSPREIDLVHTQGMHKGKTQLGIYECDGEKLRFCSSTPGQPRPVDFEARKGDGKTVAEWKLVKK